MLSHRKIPVGHSGIFRKKLHRFRSSFFIGSFANVVVFLGFPLRGSCHEVTDEV